MPQSYKELIPRQQKKATFGWLFIVAISTILKTIVESDFGSNRFAIHEETVVRAIETMVIACETEAESSSELLSSSPSDTRTETHSIAALIDQTEVASQVHEQGELMSDSAANVTDVRLKAQFVCGNSLAQNLVLGEAIAGTKGHRPMVVDVVAKFGRDRELGVIFIDFGTDAATNPGLSVDRENAYEGKS